MVPHPVADTAAGRTEAAPVNKTTGPFTWRRLALWALAGGVLLAVFAAYLEPAMAMQLAQQLWSCF